MFIDGEQITLRVYDDIWYAISWGLERNVARPTRYTSATPPEVVLNAIQVKNPCAYVTLART